MFIFKYLISLTFTLKIATTRSTQCPACVNNIPVYDQAALVVSIAYNPGALGTCPVGIFRYSMANIAPYGPRCCCQFRNYKIMESVVLKSDSNYFFFHSVDDN